MRTFAWAVLGVGAVCLAAPQDKPINAKCPVKSNQNARTQHVLLYEGQLIGFC